MKINNLFLSSFRNYGEESIKFSDGVNILLGENAQGKTNLLEAIFFLSCLKTFRSKKEADAIKTGEEKAVIRGEFEAYSQNISVLCELFSAGKKSIKINGGNLTRLSDHIGSIRTVLFSPNDLRIINDGPGLRRRFLNVAISQLRPSYIKALGEFKRLSEQKRMLLKQCAERPDFIDFLDTLNEKLAQKTAEITHFRAWFLQSLEAFAAENMKLISGGKEELSFKYIFDSAIENPLADISENAERVKKHLDMRKNAEFATGALLIGSHRDDFDVFINGSSARDFGSQGQIRSAVLAIKLAEHSILEKDGGEAPILLLDDVLSELDDTRREFLINRAVRGQVIITGCEEKISKEFAESKLFEVKNGSVSEL